MEQALEYFGVITGLLYLFLEIRQHRNMWIVGFFTSLTYVFVFFFSRFYAGMGLHLYYTLVSVYGFLLWMKVGKRQPAGKKQVLYRHISRPVFLWTMGSFLLIFSLIYYVLSGHTDSPVPMGDAFVTALSIVAMWLLAHRVLEVWWYWGVVNGVSVVLYYGQGLHPTSFLYLCNVVLVFVGYLNWKKKGTDDTRT